MSIALLNDLKNKGGLNFSEKSLLAWLAFQSEDGKTISMSVTKMLEMSGCSESTAFRILRKLEEKNVLTANGSARGRGNIQSYRIDLAVLPEIEHKKIRHNRVIREVVVESEANVAAPVKGQPLGWHPDLAEPGKFNPGEKPYIARGIPEGVLPRESVKYEPVAAPVRRAMKPSERFALMQLAQSKSMEKGQKRESEHTNVSESRELDNTSV